MDLRFSQSSQLFVFQSISFLFLFLLFIYFAVCLYIFPVFVHFNFKTVEYIKYSFAITIGKPLVTIQMIVGCAIVLILLNYLPILVLFIGGGLMSYILMWIAAKSFPKLKIQENEVGEE